MPTVVTRPLTLLRTTMDPTLSPWQLLTTTAASVRTPRLLRSTTSTPPQESTAPQATATRGRKLTLAARCRTRAQPTPSPTTGRSRRTAPFTRLATAPYLALPQTTTAHTLSV